MSPQGEAANVTSSPVTLLAYGDLTITNTTTTLNTDNADVSIAAGQLNSGDLIQIRLVVYNADTTNTLTWSIQGRDTTAQGNIVRKDDQISAGNTGFVDINLFEHPITNDLIVGVAEHIDETNATTEVNLIDPIDTNDANVFATAWTLRITGKYNASSTNNATIRYWVTRINKGATA